MFIHAFRGRCNACKYTCIHTMHRAIYSLTSNHNFSGTERKDRCCTIVVVHLDKRCTVLLESLFTPPSPLFPPVFPLKKLKKQTNNANRKHYKREGGQLLLWWNLPESLLSCCQLRPSRFWPSSTWLITLTGSLTATHCQPDWFTGRAETNRGWGQEKEGNRDEERKKMKLGQCRRQTLQEFMICATTLCRCNKSMQHT